jgi:pimeloyl-ACP methyl ester carboxylesterase
MKSSEWGLELLGRPAAVERKGPPLLFIHGGFHGAWCWDDHFMPWFAAHGFDCHAISYRDHGGSVRTGLHKIWRLKDYVEDVCWAIDQLPETPILVGHSLGGSIAQKIAATETLQGMVLLAPSPIGGSNRAAMRMTLANPGAMIRAAVKRDMAQALPAFLSFFLSDNIPAAERASIAKRLDGLTSFSAAADAFYTDTPKPRPVNFPVLVASGEYDWSIPRYKNEKLAKAYGGDHIVVPTAHDIMCDTHWQDAAQAVLTWLTHEFKR